MDIEKYTGTNTGGICPTLRVIPVSQVTSMPDVINGKITTALTVSGSWTELEVVENTAHPVEDFERNAGRNGYAYAIPFNVAKLTADRHLALEALESEPVICDYTDRNGVRRIIGSPEEGAAFRIVSNTPGKVQHDRNQFDIEINCTRRTRAPYYELTEAPEEVMLEVGDNYQGGVVAYLFESGDIGYVEGEQHGIIVADNDILGAGQDSATAVDGGAEWGCQDIDISGTSQNLRSGTSNTLLIMAGCGTQGSAAHACSTLYDAGYGDWVLPSNTDLLKIYANLGSLPGFVAEPYWSSAQDTVSATRAYSVDFSDGSTLARLKDHELRVRPVRYF